MYIVARLNLSTLELEYITTCAECIQCWKYIPRPSKADGYRYFIYGYNFNGTPEMIYPSNKHVDD